MAQQKALVVVRSKNHSAEVLFVNGSEIVDDLQDMGNDLDDMHLPDASKLEPGLWLFVGDRDPEEVGEEEWTYTGKYSRPTSEDMVDIITLDNGWE